MKAVRCRVCGVEEWSHVCGPLTASKLAGAVAKVVPARVTKIEPAVPPVTKMVAAADQVVEPNKVIDKRGRGRPKAHGTAADRQRAYRDRKAAAKVAP